MQCSVIFSTYNQPEWLHKTLLGFAAQDRHDFEVVVADDGSRDETRDLLENLRPALPFQLQHVWQEDDGFQKPIQHAPLECTVRAAALKCEADGMAVGL